MSQIDDLLDSNIDDLADLPEFALFPAGVHTCQISFVKKDVAGHPSVEMKMKHLITVELANPQEDTPPSEGAESSVLYMLDNEFGQGSLKAILKTLAGALGTSTLSDTMNAAEGFTCDVVTGIRVNKKDPTQKFQQVKKLIV